MNFSSTIYALVALLAAATPVHASRVGNTYEVREGDTLLDIARRIRPDGVSSNEMLVEIYRANPEAFSLRPGLTLLIPAREESASASARYAEGLALERRGDERAAMSAFLEAGEAGHGPAQLKLGEIFERGTSEVERDYETSRKWYARAQEQGVPVPSAPGRPG